MRVFQSIAFNPIWTFSYIIGPLNPEITVKYGAISLIFLVSGLSIKLEELLVAVTNVKIHIFIQFYSQVFTPIIVKILTLFLWMVGVNEWILKGWVLETHGLYTPPYYWIYVRDYCAFSFIDVLGSSQILKILPGPLCIILRTFCWLPSDWLPLAACHPQYLPLSFWRELLGEMRQPQFLTLCWDALLELYSLLLHFCFL